MNIKKIDVTGRIDEIDSYMESAEALLTDIFGMGTMSESISTRLLAVEAVLAAARSGTKNLLRDMNQ